MENLKNNPFHRALTVRDRQYEYISLHAMESNGLVPNLSALPYSIRILLENIVRHSANDEVNQSQITSLSSWVARAENRPTIPFFPGRVLLQDLTGVPIIVDLASLRSAVARMNGNPDRVNPVIPVDLVIDHSIQVDYSGTSDALKKNMAKEFERNSERYAFLRWAQRSIKGLRVVPPGNGIVHQVNLEVLSQVVLSNSQQPVPLVYPDTLVGTDSHTTMANCLGVLGWGVGGIEAIAAMLGHPLEILSPEVIGFHLTGCLPEGTTPFDLTLTVAQMLRKYGVVDKFIEFNGPGLKNLTLPDRAMISNMAPEYGATAVYFPVDQQTLDYLKFTDRPSELVELVEKYFKTQGLFSTDESPLPEYSDMLELDLGTIEPSVAGPKRPQDRVPLSRVKSNFIEMLSTSKDKRGYALPSSELSTVSEVHIDGHSSVIQHGSVVIASITSCTNTSNPFVLIEAGLLAKKAAARGLKPKPFVKTSFAPGSRVVAKYLEQAGLLESLADLGFQIVGYGCTTCIGNSGPLKGDISSVINDHHLVTAAVISGNRNFEGRVHASVQANYLASPPLVVAYALAGNIQTDLFHDPLGEDLNGQPVFLKDLWPSRQEVNQVIASTIQPAMYHSMKSTIFQGNEAWDQIDSTDSTLFPWNPESTYIKEPPYFNVPMTSTFSSAYVTGMRALAIFGDSTTTDHISPAGTIPQNSPAGKYLLEHGIASVDFNSYGSRRGNDEVMVRGTFANIRLKNLMVPGKEGGYSVHQPSGEQGFIYNIAMQYRDEDVPLLIIAGKEYGTGSSRDWAAKGPRLLGVKVVLAESFERIHRSNLVGMGILPIQFMPGENAQTLGLTGQEVYSITGLENGLKPGMLITILANKPESTSMPFQGMLRLNTSTEVEFIRNGGILPTTLLRLLK